MSRRWVAAAAVLGLVCAVGPAALPDGLRSIGLRAVLPIGRAPFFIGIEAASDVAFGLLTGSFFLSSEGKVLITTSYDVELAGDEEGSRTFVRATIGLYHFDPDAFLPSILFGGGLAVDVPVSSFVALGASGEFLYPLAFPAPLVSASARWLVP
jgi:hypothetical protein